MAEDPLWDAAEAKLREVVPTALEGMIVTKWILVAEIVDPRGGEKGLGTFAADGTKVWEARGMLQHAVWMDQIDELRARDD